MSTHFEPTTSELNDLKLAKIVKELRYFGSELVELQRHHNTMKEEYGKESHYAYENCVEILEKLKDDYLTLKDNMDSTIKEVLFLLEEEYGPADQKGI